MDCTSAREALMDRLAGADAGWAADDLDRHIDGCAACRAEAAALGGLWTDLGRLAVAPADALRMGRVEAALARAAAAEQVAASRWPARRRIAIAAVAGGALAAGFLLGVISGQLRAPVQPAAPAIQSAPRYLLLLHEPPAATAAAEAESRARVAEYTAWARSLRAEGRLVMAEKLGDEPAAWLPGAPLSLEGVVSGFFMILADDPSDALNVARASPHLKYGGRIEIRRIDET